MKATIGFKPNLLSSVTDIKAVCSEFCDIIERDCDAGFHPRRPFTTRKEILRLRFGSLQTALK